MKYKNILLTLFAVVFLAANAWSQPFHDVTQFDIAGVKLGMPLDEAAHVLKGKLGFTSLKEGNFGGNNVYLRTSKRAHPVSKKWYVCEYDFNAEKVRAVVNGVVQPIPGGGERVIVWRVRYEVKDGDAKTADAVLQRAKGKYGEPSFGRSAGSHHNYSWCPQPTDIPIMPDRNKPKLTVVGNKITLEDSRLERQGANAFQKVDTSNLAF